jgi:hypothetical protein
VIPITDAMKVGKEPMRTFGDLMQFYQHKTVAPTDNHPPAAAEQPAPPPAQPTAIAEQPPVTVEQPPIILEPVVAETIADVAQPEPPPVAAKGETPPTNEETPAVVEPLQITHDEGSD